MNLKLLIVFLVILSFRFYFFHQNQTQFADGQKISFETAILSQPQTVGSQQRFTANYEKQKIRITTGRFPELNYGQKVNIIGTIKLQLLNNRTTAYTMYFPKIELMKSSGVLQTSLIVVSNLRQKLILLFSQTLPSPSSSLLLGIIFGIKEQMPKDFTQNLRTAGVLHVIAASGMNVSLIAGFINTGFAFFLKRQIAIGLSILAIFFYAILAGLEPSIIRASIMGILVFSAQIIGRQTLAVNSLFLTGFAMLFLDPTLILDIGFQLSFAATAGLILIPKIKAIGKIGLIGDSISTTAAAQIATLPILLANFGIYSLWSVLVNGLVLWTVPIIMAIGAVSALLGLVFLPLGQLLIYLSYPLLLYFETIVNFFGKIRGVVVINNFPWQFTVGYYCLLISALLILKKKT